MLTLSIEIPDMALPVLNKPQPELGRYIWLSAVAKWYESGELSQENAAKLLDMTRLEFMRAISGLRVSPFQYTAEELEQELRDAD